ncbi:MAG: AtpZ/AtpI family protein [Patescibacteria group bacterium]|nr:AtpZ/AtpI family protein [Patescibacteria group bacterium]MDD5294304.1 AtpZ/AtpI family protein [Patescibacteria group bacterium]MDD5554127.1 AtpZ/AtpI family protein [Patescibacteria group bacterium]
MGENLFGKYKSVRQLSLALAIYSSTSIFGPLIIIGGIGWYLDKVFNTRPWLLVISIFIAFIVTNILLFKKVIVLNRWIKQQKELAKNKKNNEGREENNLN